MSEENEYLRLPDYEEFSATISVLMLHISASLLHGMMCGYLCAGADNQGESYLRALLNNKKDNASRNAVLAMFSVFSISQQQINSMDFEFEMMLPHEDESLLLRAQAFSEWCEGFTQALTLSGISANQFQEEEAQDAFQHLIEFAELDCDTLDVDEEDERALMEVSEYARMAVLRLHSDLVLNEKETGGHTGITH
ncbi:Putative conserved exported protein precursor [Legionella wadsworthii]|uniref:Conserved exported protein n=1 Tax=Legionella wadsworthii TaxID=28088 RepID=A0A378LWS5_9GAMM|nr:YecA family protein [Legionella wadsworthii]STY31696.1 Putative conserved exported protein precursor [Legionella wadsworthii]